MIKAKNASTIGKDLFSVLKTPDVKRKMIGQLDLSSRKPSILKGAYSDTDSERGSETHKQLKVSFDFNGKKFKVGKTPIRSATSLTQGNVSDHIRQDDERESESSENFDPLNDDPFSTPSKSRYVKFICLQ